MRPDEMRPVHTYVDGPWRCAPSPAVRRDISNQIKRSRALSPSDVRLAAAMGLVHADVKRPPGLNDGIIYPPEVVDTHTPTPRGRPLDRLRRATTRKKTLHALALLVDFADNPGQRPPSEFERLLFDAGNAGSMTSYYHQLSKGALAVTGEVIGYIRAPRPYASYTAGESGMGDSFPNNTPGLLVDALTEFTRTDSLQRFDQDGDGFVDGIFLIHAGGGAEAERQAARRPNMIWSHKWVLPRPFVSQGVSVYAYSTEPEDGRLGVFAHEFGHVLGLPDLYDPTYRSEGVGDWCLMAGGSWGGGGDRPCRMSAWCLAKLGWIKPRVPRRSRTVSLPTLEKQSDACYRLRANGGSPAEYFLIENRQRVGMDTALPGSGLALWHVDETQSENSNPRSYLVGLVQADGDRDLESNRNGGDAGDLFPGSESVAAVDDGTQPSTRTYDGTATGIGLSNIRTSEGVITLRMRI